MFATDIRGSHVLDLTGKWECNWNTQRYSAYLSDQGLEEGALVSLKGITKHPQWPLVDWECWRQSSTNLLPGLTWGGKCCKDQARQRSGDLEKLKSWQDEWQWITIIYRDIIQTSVINISFFSTKKNPTPVGEKEEWIILAASTFWMSKTGWNLIIKEITSGIVWVNGEQHTQKKIIEKSTYSRFTRHFSCHAVSDRVLSKFLTHTREPHNQ